MYGRPSLAARPPEKVSFRRVAAPPGPVRLGRGHLRGQDPGAAGAGKECPGCPPSSGKVLSRGIVPVRRRTVRLAQRCLAPRPGTSGCRASRLTTTVAAVAGGIFTQVHAYAKFNPSGKFVLVLTPLFFELSVIYIFL